MRTSGHIPSKCVKKYHVVLLSFLKALASWWHHFVAPLCFIASNSNLQLPAGICLQKKKIRCKENLVYQRVHLLPNASSTIMTLKGNILNCVPQRSKHQGPASTLNGLTTTFKLPWICLSNSCKIRLKHTKSFIRAYFSYSQHSFLFTELF